MGEIRSRRFISLMMVFLIKNRVLIHRSFMLKNNNSNTSNNNLIFHPYIPTQYHYLYRIKEVSLNLFGETEIISSLYLTGRVVPTNVRYGFPHGFYF